MALQILQSRLFSVVTWYHLSFLVISIAMFGLTLGALKIYKGDPEKQTRNLPSILQDTAFMFGITTVAGLISQMMVPIISDKLLHALITLPLVAGMTAWSYYYAGQIVSLCLTRANKPAGLVYGIDLVGAAAGCLIALGLMQTLDAPSSILLIAGAAMLAGVLFAAQEKKAHKLFLFSALAVMAFGIVNATLPKPIIYTAWSKGAYIAQSKINFEKWNTISRVTIIDGLPGRNVYLWGPSPLLPKDTKADYQYLMIDGDASTPLTKFDGQDWSKLKYLEYDVTNTAYFMPAINSVAIIGVGGGRDLLSARYFGAQKTVAMDVNPIQVGLLTTDPFYSAYTGHLNNLPDSRIVNSEARNWFSRSDEKYDLIQMSLIDTWAATGAGAFALSENSIYTVDAFKIFFADLNNQGALTVSRWQHGDSYTEIGRMLSMTISALLDLGVQDPWKNIIMTHSGNIATLVAGRDALTPEQLTAIEQAAQKYQYEILISPHKPADEPILNTIYKATSNADIIAAVKDLPYDLTPPDDMRPFFFNQARITQPLQLIRSVIAPTDQIDTASGHTLATINLYVIIVFSILVALLVLVLPFRNAVTEAPKSFVSAGTAYFAMIGLGFMFIEISLMQIMTMFLGHPVYSLGIVLFSLILSAGIGSLLSEKKPILTGTALVFWTGLIFVYVAGLSFFIDPLIKAMTEQPFAIRVAISIAIIMPCGLLLGYGFPTGMKMTEAVSPKMTAWFWGINGACGVVASALAVLVSIGWGLDKTLLTGACLYGLLAFPALRLLKFSQTASRP